MTSFEPNVVLRLSIQRALIGSVTPRLVGVTCGLENSVIRVRAYVNGKVTSEDINWLQEISTEVIADFPVGYVIEEECLCEKNGSEEMLDFWAFLLAR